ncbi:MAG: ATP-binding cassette domain-containing protein [Pseudobdellovibrio sp.]
MKKINSIHDIIKFLLFDRLIVRVGIMTLAFLATLAGVALPYFQKDFSQTLALSSLLICTGLAFLSFILLQLTNYYGQKEALLSQKALSDQLYQHILRLKPFTTNNKSVGEMVALYTTDTPSSTMWLEQTVPYALTTAFPLIITPVFLNMIYDIPYSLIISIIAVIIGVNVLLARRQSFFFSNFKKLAGDRMGLVNEWIQNIKGLKSLNWIEGFENKIIKKRIEETNNRVAMVTNGQIMNSISSSITFWLNLAVLFFISYFHSELIGKVDLIAIMWIMGIFLAKPLRQLPWFFTMMFDAWTSVKRLGDFFSLTNREFFIKNTTAHLAPSESCVVENLTLSIDNTHILDHVSFTLHKNEITALIGPVGAGKSILIKSLMKETPFVANKLITEPYCYLPQEPFILSATLKENIIFDYNTAQFSDNQAMKSLHQAQFDLTQDRISDGLNTVIGERGLNISGGQKQRLNLSRLFYNPQPLFLLDDPFSAVDVGTEKKLINVILDLKKQNHTFLVVTQRYEFLNYCDRIIYLEDGKIEFDGQYEKFKVIEKYKKFIEGDVGAGKIQSKSEVLV